MIRLTYAVSTDTHPICFYRMYPELLTRPDLKTFLPPIGGLTVYIFGPVSYLSDPTKELTVRVHDECNGSDVFGSDICTWYVPLLIPT